MRYKYYNVCAWNSIGARGVTLNFTNLPSSATSRRFCWPYFSNSFKNIQMYRNVFFFGPDKTLIISQHLSKFSAYRHSSSIGLANGSADASSNINKASAAVYGLPAEFKKQKSKDVKCDSYYLIAVNRRYHFSDLEGKEFRQMEEFSLLFIGITWFIAAFNTKFNEFFLSWQLYSAESIILPQSFRIFFYIDFNCCNWVSISYLRKLSFDGCTNTNRS